MLAKTNERRSYCRYGRQNANARVTCVIGETTKGSTKAIAHPR